MHEPLDRLYQDPVGALVQDLCSRIFWPTVSGSCRRTCAEISVSRSCGTTCARSLCEDPLDHLYHDFVGALVQDLCQDLLPHCIRIL